ETGVGFSTDTRLRASLNYRDVDFANRALQFTTDLSIEQALQNASVRLVGPPDERGWSLAGTFSVQRTDISGLITDTTSIGGQRISPHESTPRRNTPALIRERPKTT